MYGARFPDDGVRVVSNSNVLKKIESKLNIGISSTGILVIGNNNFITECSTLMNQLNGIDISLGQNNCILKCECNKNNNYGYSIIGTNTNNKLLLNTASENSNDGFFINSSPNTIFQNISNQNKTRGILVGAVADDNNIVKNLICNNSSSGIEIVNGSFRNAIDSNTVRNNGTDMTDAGILVNSGVANNTIRFNRARNNVIFDIEAIPPANFANTFDGNKCGNSDPPGLCI
ncbi:right-handed parallel beta-helix repeat-containing protein [Bacillus spongiae]|uniref:Right-handed parallel beta-helix repeat-containing protein n=1 Tax=Bacillus spongiae TaxID=2683610 RepID=A0ABU8H8U5_9BACI